MPGRDRAKTVPIALLIQERSRELAGWSRWTTEPIARVPRRPYLPRLAAHFFYYAAGRTSRYVGAGADPQPLGGRRPGDPVELPLMMLREIAPSLAAGQHP